MQKIFSNKYTNQKDIVEKNFFNLVSDFSKHNKKEIETTSIAIVQNAIDYKIGSQFGKLIHEFSL